ncbi:ATP-dependent RecD-like DNA helicase [Candidatus Aerophobetes bacterium]|uniref:ATP-dependent RecD-like DNA helicase n=1 Tax=Aerophobetes bacterium TaxID=2030807 RepID=A0A2A4X6C7_UNCAE|nr:MAG: ATP-dependent RecD-like DNA helicase [Candidatus Aerophobetes bacterium]
MEEFPQEALSGLVESVVFESEETGYKVIKIKLPRENDLVILIGMLAGCSIGQTLHAKGKWKLHPRHGRQFSVESFEVEKPRDLIGIQKYLESGHIKGIGPAFARKIVEKFGLKTLDIIDNSPSRLMEVEGLGAKRMQTLVASISDEVILRKVMIFLRGHGVSPVYAQKIYKHYGDSCIEVVKENPYRLAKEIHGMGFKSADLIAQNLDIGNESTYRIDAGIEFLLTEIAKDGHSCYEKIAFVEKSATLLNVGEELIVARLETLLKEETIIEKSLLYKDQPTSFLYSRPLFFSELSIAKELYRLSIGLCGIRTIDMEKALLWAETKMGMHFAKGQKEAIAKSMAKKVSIITGGPGTGKSTITKAILGLTSQISPSILLAAPTGKAAKRMSEITGKQAKTIHSLLSFDFTTGLFKKNRKNPLECDLIIIDEASMIDCRLMASLLVAIPSNSRIIFIGDVDQLPSVGPGKVLEDLIHSNQIDCTYLKFIFRQAKGSSIITNAHNINQGFFPSLSGDDDDFTFIEENEPENIIQHILNLTSSVLPSIEGGSFHPINDVQILSPMKKGLIGTDNLNTLLQETLNPGQISLSKMGRSFRLFDKVMQRRNNYDKKVYNGDVGRIVKIDTSTQTLSIVFDEEEVIYTSDELDEIMLAYAVSIHKYQGSECPAVIIPIHTSHFKLLFKNLLYTGVTRGKKKVFLIGSKRAIAIAINSKQAVSRFTGLSSVIEETFTKELLS